MSPEAKDLLMRALRVKGESLLSEPSQCRALLKDFAKGGHKREIRCLVTALEIGCVQRMKSESAGGSHLLRRQMVDKLHEDRGVDTDLGFWVVETWAEVLCWLKRDSFDPLTGGRQLFAPALPLGPRLHGILHDEKLEFLQPFFEAHAVADSVLNALDDTDLREIGVAEFITRQLLLAAIQTSPDTATKDSPFENGLGMKFVSVPGVSVLFSIWETRVRDYEAFARLNGMSAPKPSFPQTPNDPMVNVSWNEAKAFCAWLTEKEEREGRIGRSQSYRLPTDAEWSVAVGLPPEKGKTPEEKDGGIADFYPWGNKWPPQPGVGNYASVLIVDSFQYTSPVGSFAANRHGLYDLGGNVWEWCGDRYGEWQNHRVVRGGSYESYARAHLNSSCRFYDDPGSRRGSYGFRCVLGGGPAP